MLAVTQKQMRMIDEYMIGVLKIPGVLLMENAALGVIGRILKDFPDERPGVLVVCGLGNNGGDGFAIARGLLARGFDARVILIGDPGDLKGDALLNFEILGALGDVVTVVDTSEELDRAMEAEADTSIVVDALFGTGLTRAVGGIHLEAVRAINRMDAFCVSVDIPSGVSGDTGAVMGEAVRADATVTFQYPKIGHFVYPGKGYAGELDVVTIGTDEGCPVLREVDVFAYDSKSRALTIQPRSADTNKGDYGRLMIIAGSVGMAGAAVLASRAAIRTGAGLTTLASVDYVVSVVQKTVPEATCKVLAGEIDSLTRNAIYEADRFMKDKTALAVGPGILENAETQELVSHMVETHEITKVFDADALNVISRNTEILLEKTGDVILTPHPKEFSRLTGRPVAEILADPVDAARSFIQDYDVTLVLKGTTTIVADRERGCALISAGSPGMAKGGSGDVLTGVIASLAAQGKSAFDAAALGVMIAGTAGEMAAKKCGEYAMTASDTVDMIGSAIDALTEELQEKKRPGRRRRAKAEEAVPEDGINTADGYDDEGYETIDIPEEEEEEDENLGQSEDDAAEEPELFIPQEDAQEFARPKKAETPHQPYMRRKIEPKE
jgi:NAD(P)H-hydrate epimerase